MRLSIILALILAGCAPPEVAKEEPAPVAPVKVRPNPDYRTNLAWYYCDKTDAYIELSRAPIVDGRVMGVTHTEVFLDWMAECEDLAQEWDNELSNRERWE